MSPLIAQPNRGYADYQRIENWDSGVLWNLNVPLGVANQISPIIDMSRYAYLGGWVQENASRYRLDITWYADSGGVTPLAGRTLCIDTQILNPAQVRLPNLGPFVQFLVRPLAGVAFQPQIVIIGTNRFHPLEFIPAVRVLFTVQAQAVGANATFVAFPFDYYAGPISVWASAGTPGPWSLTMLALDTQGNYPLTDGLSGIGAGNTRVQMCTPPGAWALNVTNNAGVASSLYLVVTYPATGSL